MNILRAQTYFNCKNDQSLMKIMDALESLNIEEFAANLSKLYNFPRHQDFKSEAEFENSLSKILMCCNIAFTTQPLAGHGRAYLAFETNFHAFVVELKYNKSADEAMDHIIKKRYYQLPLFNEHNEIMLLGINYSSMNKNIDSIAYINYKKEGTMPAVSSYVVRLTLENNIVVQIKPPKT